MTIKLQAKMLPQLFIATLLFLAASCPLLCATRLTQEEKDYMEAIIDKMVKRKTMTLVERELVPIIRELFKSTIDNDEYRRRKKAIEERCQASTKSLTLHGGPVIALSFHPKKSLLLSAGHDGRLCLFDTQKEVLVEQRVAYCYPWSGLCFDKKGRWTAATRDDAGLVLVSKCGLDGKWCTANMPFRCLAASHDGRLLACGGGHFRREGGVILYDTSTWQEKRSLLAKHSSIVALDFDAKGTYLAALTDKGRVLMWRTNKWEERTPILAQGVTAICFNRRGTLLVTGHERGHLYLWDPVSGKKRGEFPRTRHAIRALSFSHDDNFLAAGYDKGSIILWDRKTRRFLHRLRGHRQTVRTLAFNQSDRLLASGSDDGNIILWNNPLSKHKPRLVYRQDQQERYPFRASIERDGLSVNVNIVGEEGPNYVARLIHETTANIVVTVQKDSRFLKRMD